MMPIQDLLHRVRWDPEFGRGSWVLGYLDRPTGAIVRVPFNTVRFPEGDRFSVETTETDGTVHAVPLHRIREMWKDGRLVWSR